MTNLVLKPKMIALLVAYVVVSPLIAIFVSTRIAAGTIEEAEQAARRSDCAFLSSTLAVYRETPPTTDTGRALLATYVSEYASPRLRCANLERK